MPLQPRCRETSGSRCLMSHRCLTLTHVQLAAGITISVTCDRERDVPLSILTRHLFFGFKDIEVLQQGSQMLNGVPALKTVARARLDAREVQLSSSYPARWLCL